MQRKGDRGERTLNVANVNNVGLPASLPLSCAPLPLALHSMPARLGVSHCAAQPRHFQDSSTPLRHSYLERKDDDDDLEEKRR